MDQEDARGQRPWREWDWRRVDGQWLCRSTFGAALAAEPGAAGFFPDVFMVRAGRVVSTAASWQEPSGAAGLLSE